MRCQEHEWVYRTKRIEVMISVSATTAVHDSFACISPSDNIFLISHVICSLVILSDYWEKKFAPAWQFGMIKTTY